MKYSKRVVGNLEGKDIVAHNIKHENGFEVEILNLGGIITKIITPDKDNNLENIVASYKNIESYYKNPSYFGAIIGRTSGRICEGKVIIEGKEYNLNKNYGLHQGHGGTLGFNSKVWDVDINEKDNLIELILSAKSYDNEENYPGNLDVKVTFKIYENYTIEEIYEGKSDKTTLVNMTNHSYFNLSGDLKRPVTDQYMKLDSSDLVEIDETCVPTGKILDVTNTPFDFRSMKCIGDDIDDVHDQIKIGCGYDHPFLLEGNKRIYMEDKISKRNMSITTNQNSVVIYSMNFTDDETLHNGKKSQRRHGICFETQAPPIGRNMCFMEESLLKKDDLYYKSTTYKFGLSN